MFPSEVETMTESEWRHSVTSMLNRIDTTLNGIEGDDNSYGLKGQIGKVLAKVEYEELQRKRDVLPRITHLNDRVTDVEHTHDNHIARLSGQRQALTIALSVLSGVGVTIGIFTAL